MTIDEASRKWCPMYRCSTNNGQMSDNATHGASGYCCISNCMAWRWEIIYGNMPSSGRIVENGRSTEKGYCGLFGRE